MLTTLRVELTNYCNRKCPYCFFNEKLTNERVEMPWDEYQYIIRQCEREKIDMIYIQGGEPTTHSRFGEILPDLKKRGFTYRLFTNGIFKTDLLDTFDKNPENEILLNYNHPDTYKNIKEWELVNKNIEEMLSRGIKFDLGYTMYEKNPDFGFLLDALKKYRVNRLRWDFARPSGKCTNKYFELKEFPKMLEVVSGFLKECFKIKPHLNQFNDCVIPVCSWFAGGQFVLPHKDNFMQILCTSAINIGPGLLIGTCPGGIQFENIKLTDFQSITQLTHFVEYEARELVDNVWLLDECEDCIHRINKECRGGCIGQKRLKKNKVVGRDELARFLSSYNPADFADKEKEMMFGRVKPEAAESVDRAIKKYQEQLKKDEGSSYALYSLGICYEAKGEFEKAIQTYEQLSSRPEMRRIIRNRLDLVYQLRNVERNPKNKMAWLRLRDVAYLTGYAEESNKIHSKWGDEPVRR